MLVLDLQKQLEETRRVCDTLTSEKLNMQILLENVRDEDRISYLEHQNKELQETLLETQAEFEQLIGEHEDQQQHFDEIK